jgi:hypothetical protein
VRVLFFPVGGSAEVRHVEGDTLRAFQKLVGGYVEGMNLEDGLQLICNEEGKLTGLPPNRHVQAVGDVILGPFVVSRHDAQGEAVDVTDADVEKYRDAFSRVG